MRTRSQAAARLVGGVASHGNRRRTKKDSASGVVSVEHDEVVRVSIGSLNGEFISEANVHVPSTGRPVTSPEEKPRAVVT